MYIVYVLKDKDGKMYKGLTSDLKRRLREHRTHGSRTTSLMDKESLKVVYTEECNNLSEARKREKYFKSSAGRRFLKQQLNSL